jgi:hypothetical protein
MKCIQKIYIKLLGIFKKNTSIRTNSLPINSEKYIASLEFSLTDQEYLDIRCKIPETKDKSIEDITALAEKYANLLVRINDGSFKNDIAKILQKTIDNSNEEQINDQLLANNILYFWAILHIENEKNKNLKPNKPIIKPSSVFKTTP